MDSANPAKAGEELISFCVGLMLKGVKCMADRSRMNREIHVRICEGLGVRFPRATRLLNLEIKNFQQDDISSEVYKRICYFVKHPLVKLGISS